MIWLFPAVMFGLLIMYLLIMLAMYGLSSQRRTSYEKRQLFSTGGIVYGAAIVLLVWSATPPQAQKHVSGIGWMDAVQQFVDQYRSLLLLFGGSLAIATRISGRRQGPHQTATGTIPLQRES